MGVRTSALVNVIVAAARKAARGLIRDFGEVEHLQVSKKGPGDFVSAADHRVEEMLRRELGRARPAYSFLCEESGASAGSDAANVWVIDPIDGTTNFLHGIPHFAVSIALVREGEPVAGVVYQPLSDEMFWAEKGVGAYVNERRLRVSARRKLEDAVVNTGVASPARPDCERRLRQLGAVAAAAGSVRCLGSAALDLAYVAAGRCDAYWEAGVKAWDIAAGVLLVREAGGYVSEIEGGHAMLSSGSVLAANDHLHLPLGTVLRSV